MKKIYIDADSFANPQFVSQAIRIHSTKNANTSFLIKGKKEDLVTLMNKENVEIVSEISEKDLKDYTYRLIANDDAINTFDGSSTFYRFIHEGKEIKNLVVTIDPTSSADEISNLVLEAKNIFRAVTKKPANDLKISSIKGFNLDKAFLNRLSEIQNYQGELEIKDLFVSSSDIILVDNTSAFYLFNIVEALANPKINAENTKEKVNASFFSKKLFTFTRDKDEMDYDNLFLYYFIEIKNGIKYFHIKRLANLTSLFKILYDIDEL